jgi:hypothetical protein
MRRPLILATCALALVAAGCGGSSKKSDTTAPAASGSSSSGSAATDAGLFSGIKQQDGPAKLDLALNVKLDGAPTGAGAAGALLSQPISLKVNGVTDSAKKASDVDLALNLGALALNAKVLSDGTKSWIKYDDNWYVLDTSALAGAAGGVTGSSAKPPSVDTSKLRAALGDPSQFFKDAKKVGDEKVGDIDTEHITGTLDVAKALDAAKSVSGTAGTSGTTTTPIDPAQAQKIEDAFKDPKVDVWIGKDDRVVHRLAFKLNGDLSGLSGGATQGVNGVAVDLDATMLPADSPTITPPANAKSTQELLAQILGGLGPALGVGALPTATG